MKRSARAVDHIAEQQRVDHHAHAHQRKHRYELDELAVRGALKKEDDEESGYEHEAMAHNGAEHAETGA